MHIFSPVMKTLIRHNLIFSEVMLHYTLLKRASSCQLDLNEVCDVHKALKGDILFFLALIYLQSKCCNDDEIKEQDVFLLIA